VEKHDSTAQADRLLERILGYRIFEDEQGRMNRSLQDIEGGLLLVPQFTLAADTRKGRRPSFDPAAPPELGKRLFNHMLAAAQQYSGKVASGRFGADMQVQLINDGPATFWLQC
jgi:D-tyrosyl-tRNA(Tyr) deacylase